MLQSKAPNLQRFAMDNLPSTLGQGRKDTRQLCCPCCSPGLAQLLHVAEPSTEIAVAILEVKAH